MRSQKSGIASRGDLLLPWHLLSSQAREYALTWDDVFQSFDLRHAFLLDKLKMDKEAIAAEIAQTAGDEKSKDTTDALTALVAN